jgi:hypothetical protein
VIAGHDRHAGGGHERLGRILEAHGADRGGWRADEHDAVRRAGLGELDPLGQEAVARMDRRRPGAARDFDDPVDAQVALGRGRRTDEMGLVGRADEERAGIGLGMNRDGADAERAGSADNAAGDFATIGDEDRREHQNPPFHGPVPERLDDKA